MDKFKLDTGGLCPKKIIRCVILVYRYSGPRGERYHPGMSHVKTQSENRPILLFCFKRYLGLYVVHDAYARPG